VDREKRTEKNGRFIQVALAGADFAVRMANWKRELSDLDEVGVYVSSGIGGFDIIEREHGKLLNGGPGKISPFFIPSAIVNLASGTSRFGMARAVRIPRQRRHVRLRHTLLAIPLKLSSVAPLK